MSNASRKARGMRTQLVVAEWFKERGWPYAESTGAGRSGVDVKNLPGLACEVKARRDFSPIAFLKQAAKGADGLPFCVVRPDGLGEQNVHKWGVMMTLEDFTDLLHKAGYGV